jgi:beta-lactamase superfamily II metal-dependent hydrolase
MWTDPPASDVVEVSIFGPGKGECVLVHLGSNLWIVVDSCKDQRNHQVSALTYLDRIGVNPAEAVTLVVATHADDDHFSGIAEVFDRCESSVFVCSEAITKEEFFALTKADDHAHAGLRVRAFSEYRQVFDIISSRSSSRPGFRPLRRALEQRSLLQGTRADNDTRVLALSPSDEAVSRSQLALASALPVPGQPRKLVKVNPNELAVALWVEALGKRILLGADLLYGPDGCGWIAVLATFTPEAPASVFKVSHHGSITGHHDGIWRQLLQESPIALLAPFRSGNVSLPTTEDRRRILSLTNEAFITAGTRMPAAPRAVRKEAVSLGPLARNVREPWGTVGHVRARSIPGQDTWTVDFSAPAQRLSSA